MQSLLKTNNKEDNHEYEFLSNFLKEQICT